MTDFQKAREAAIRAIIDKTAEICAQKPGECVLVEDSSPDVLDAALSALEGEGWGIYNTRQVQAYLDSERRAEQHASGDAKQYLRGSADMAQRILQVAALKERT